MCGSETLSIVHIQFNLHTRFRHALESFKTFSTSFVAFSSGVSGTTCINHRMGWDLTTQGLVKATVCQQEYVVARDGCVSGTTGLSTHVHIIHVPVSSTPL